MWKHLLRSLVALLALLAGTSSELQATFAATATPSGDTSRVPPVEFVDMPSSLTEMVEWAVDLFDEAGLELPPLRFVHHEGDLDACHGKPGLHRSVEDVSYINICQGEPSFATRTVILHETAHAWASHSLSREREADFQELRGWDHWLDYDASAWFENGSEQAAEIMVWGLLDRPIRIITIEQNSCDELEIGYRVLTGTPPLHGFRELCGL